MIETIDIVIDLNANSKRRKLKVRTMAKTKGKYSSVISTESTTSADDPPTYTVYWLEGTAINAAGISSFLSRLIEFRAVWF